MERLTPGATMASPAFLNESIPRKTIATGESAVRRRRSRSCKLATESSLVDVQSGQGSEGVSRTRGTETARRSSDLRATRTRRRTIRAPPNSFETAPDSDQERKTELAEAAVRVKERKACRRDGVTQTEADETAGARQEREGAREKSSRCRLTIALLPFMKVYMKKERQTRRGQVRESDHVLSHRRLLAYV